MEGAMKDINTFHLEFPTRKLPKPIKFPLSFQRKNDRKIALHEASPKNACWTCIGYQRKLNHLCLDAILPTWMVRLSLLKWTVKICTLLVFNVSLKFHPNRAGTNGAWVNWNFGLLEINGNFSQPVPYGEWCFSYQSAGWCFPSKVLEAEGTSILQNLVLSIKWGGCSFRNEIGATSKKLKETAHSFEITNEITSWYPILNTFCRQTVNYLW